VRPHGKSGFMLKFQITKNKGRPIIELGESVQMVMIVLQMKLLFG